MREPNARMSSKDIGTVSVDELSEAQARAELKRLAGLIRHHDELLPARCA